MAELTLTADDIIKEGAMPSIDEEISAYDRIREDLEAHHMGEWIVMRDGKIVGTYSSFEVAASEAVSKFGRGPYLIRQIGAPPMIMPAAVMYSPSHG